jgi:hypothetical protein
VYFQWKAGRDNQVCIARDMHCERRPSGERHLRSRTDREPELSSVLRTSPRNGAMGEGSLSLPDIFTEGPERMLDERAHQRYFGGDDVSR